MPVLYHSPLSAPSRFIRLVIGELGMEVDLREEALHERRREFLALNPAGTVPVLVEHEGPAVPGAATLAEYLDETRGLVLGERRLLPEAPAPRVEVRRLTDWFLHKFDQEAGHPIVHEKVEKRLAPAASESGSPDARVLRAARTNLRYHLTYLAHLLARRNWLAGDRLTYADLAAAAALSSVDYLGDVPWETEPVAKEWYARMKSRPSFRPILLDRLPGIPPAATYANLDF